MHARFVGRRYIDVAFPTDRPPCALPDRSHPQNANERETCARSLFFLWFRGLQHRLGFFFLQEPLQNLPLGCIDRGLQQVLKSFDVGVCGIGEISHRRPPRQDHPPTCRRPAPAGELGLRGASRLRPIARPILCKIAHRRTLRLQGNPYAKQSQRRESIGTFPI